MTNLAEVLKWLVSGGAGVVAYWLMENISFLVTLAPEWKSYVSLALAAVLAVIGYLAQVAMNYTATPVDWRGWLEVLFAVIGVAVGLSKILHARLQLRGKTRCSC